jgi:hypothetical protein
VAPAYQKLLEQGRTKFLGYGELEATSRVIGLLVDHQPVDSIAVRDRGGTGASTGRRSTPKPAARLAIAAGSYSATGEKVADVEIRLRRQSPG